MWTACNRSMLINTKEEKKIQIKVLSAQLERLRAQYILKTNENRTMTKKSVNNLIKSASAYILSIDKAHIFESHKKRFPENLENLQQWNSDRNLNSIFSSKVLVNIFQQFLCTFQKARYTLRNHNPWWRNSTSTREKISSVKNMNEILEGASKLFRSEQ